MLIRQGCCFGSGSALFLEAESGSHLSENSNALVANNKAVDAHNGGLEA
jgi:hypothetical protein